jgi:hypothetical protein
MTSPSPLPYNTYYHFYIRSIFLGGNIVPAWGSPTWCYCKTSLHCEPFFGKAISSLHFSLPSQPHIPPSTLCEPIPPLQAFFLRGNSLQKKQFQEFMSMNIFNNEKIPVVKTGKRIELFVPFIPENKKIHPSNFSLLHPQASP